MEGTIPQKVSDLSLTSMCTYVHVSGNEVSASPRNKKIAEDPTSKAKVIFKLIF